LLKCGAIGALEYRRATEFRALVERIERSGVGVRRSTI
jgi:hypothetical protein